MLPEDGRVFLGTGLSFSSDQIVRKLRTKEESRSANPATGTQYAEHKKSHSASPV
jgi:hypothetical protein